MKLYEEGAFYKDGALITEGEGLPEKDVGRIHTMSADILYFHSASGHLTDLTLGADLVCTAKEETAKVLDEVKKTDPEYFPLPYVMADEERTDKEGSLGFSAALRYGGIFECGLPVWRFMAEAVATCSSLVLSGSGPLPLGAIGTLCLTVSPEEIANQLLGSAVACTKPGANCVYITGEWNANIPPMAIAKAILAAGDEYTKGAVLEIAGPGIASIPLQARCGVDKKLKQAGVLTTLWETDDAVKDFYVSRDREEGFEKTRGETVCFYDRAFEIDLSEVPLSETPCAMPCFAFTKEPQDTVLYEKNALMGFPIPHRETELCGD